MHLYSCVTFLVKCTNYKKVKLMSSLPRVVIVGRTNVGKSTLFNRLSTEVKSLTFDESGVTRDFLSDVVSWQGRTFELVDTGGISLQKTQDQILDRVRKQAIAFLEQADIILFVGDSAVGLVAEDREIVRVLHRIGKPVLLVVNKVDKKGASDQLYEFEQTGFKQIFPISAEHGTGIGDLLDVIVQELPERSEREQQEPTCKIAILGKPNVGKSSLMNILSKEERSIVSDVPGTTREALKKNIMFHQEDIQITDTAGLRRKRGITEPLEQLMAKSSLRALKNSDIVLLVIDASEGRISDQELKLAFYAFEQGKALMLVFNKADLMTEELSKELENSLSEYDYFFKKIGRIDISCKSGKNVGKILPRVRELYERYTQRFTDEELTLICKEALKRKPMYHNQQRLEVKWAKQVKTGPISIVFKVNVHQWFGASQLMFFDNVLRKHFDLTGVPLILIPRRNI